MVLPQGAWCQGLGTRPEERVGMGNTMLVLSDLLLQRRRELVEA